jgi:type II secretory pathway pseudopilin PulG
METVNVKEAIDLTAVVIAVIGGVFATIRIVATYMIDKRVKDQQLREVLQAATRNALGVIQQAASGAAVRYSPSLNGLVPSHLAPGVQYVMDHAGEALRRFNITPEKVAEKIVSQAGRLEIETNIAVSGSSSPVISAPLAPSSPVTGDIAAELNRRELQSILATNPSRGGA